MMAAGEYWYNNAFVNDEHGTIGTWQGITRSTEPTFMSVPIAPSTGASFAQYALSNSCIVYYYPQYVGRIDGIGVPDVFNPDLVLPEGL